MSKPSKYSDAQFSRIVIAVTYSILSLFAVIFAVYCIIRGC